MCEVQILAVRGSSVRGAAESFIDVEGTASDCASGIVVVTIRFAGYEVTSRTQVGWEGIWAARQIRARSWCDEVITVNAYCEGQPECAATTVPGTIVCSDPPPNPPLRHNGFLVAYVQPRYLMPGQPFQVRWSLFDDEHPTDPQRAQLQWEPGQPLPPPTSGADSWTAVSPINVGPADLGAAVNRFYRVHDDDFVLQATNGHTWLARVPQFSVRPGPSPVVTFTGPHINTGPGIHYDVGELREATWNLPYTISFTLRNPSPFADVTLRYTLTEAAHSTEMIEPMVIGGVGATLGPAIPLTPIDSATQTVPKGETVTVDWPALRKDWPWMNPTTFALSDAIIRGFRYQVTVTGTDEFGNELAPVVSEPTTVLVEVPDQKFRDELTAWYAMLWSSSLSTMAGVMAAVGAEEAAAVVASAAAALLSATAQPYGTNAQDPPSPDPDFEDLVVIKVPQLPTALTEHDGLRHFSSWVAHLYSIAVLRASLYKIEAKYLGASEAENDEGRKKQATSYRDVFQKIAEHAAHVVDGASEAARELSAIADPKAMAARSADMAERGFSASEIELFRKHGLDTNAIAQVGYALAKHVASAEPWIERLARICDSTRRSIDALARESAHLLSE